MYFPFNANSNAKNKFSADFIFCVAAKMKRQKKEHSNWKCVSHNNSRFKCKAYLHMYIIGTICSHLMRN